MTIFSVDNGHKPINVLPIHSLMTFLDAPKDGMVQITGEGITWCLDFFKGRLRYCNHSRQTFSAVELHLQSLGYGAAIEPSWRIFHQQTRDRHESPDRLSSLAWMNRLVQQLAIQGSLSWEQANVVSTQLFKDSLEPALWLTSGDITLLDNTATIYEPYDTRWQGSRSSVVMQILVKRYQVWQELGPHIRSPHQCPYFTDTQRTHESVPGGIIPTSMLLALKQVMGEVSLRHLSQLLRQDELKLAQLLYPYVEQGIVVFGPPEPPLNDLPLVPAARSVIESSSSIINKHGGKATSNLSDRHFLPSPLASPPLSSGFSKGWKNSSPQPQKRTRKQYKIVCIDDSPTMLETLKCYLDDDCFDVTTLANPMQSASTMFSSRPDLILMDVAMPGINGDRLCKILRQSSAFKTTPIIMVTGLTGEVNKADAIAMGADDYLAKPFAQEVLLELMDQYLHFLQ